MKVENRCAGVDCTFSAPKSVSLTAPKIKTGNNPTGKNQWPGNRARKPIAVRLPLELDQWLRVYIGDYIDDFNIVRLPLELDQWLRHYAYHQGLSLTQVIEEAVKLKQQSP